MRNKIQLHSTTEQFIEQATTKCNVILETLSHSDRSFIHQFITYKTLSFYSINSLTTLEDYIRLV